jgi:hypothetical protein
MQVPSIVSQILAAKDETDQLQISNTALRATTIAGAIAAAENAEQVSAANPPGVGDNLDLSA